MLSEKDLFKNGINEIIKIFGKKYLQDNYEGTCVAKGLIDPSTFMVFVGLKTSKQLPGRKATEKGWVVYAEILIDAFSGNIKSENYILE